ncbi:Vacuolar protein sorting-associated protein 16-like protein [Plecturocebus cupreus]
MQPAPQNKQLPADGCLLHLLTSGTLHRHRLHLDGDGITQGEAIRMSQMRMWLKPLTRSWGTHLVSLTLTLLHEPMAVAAPSCHQPARMKRNKLALSKAIESGDTDLVFIVLLHLKNELNRGDFFHDSSETAHVPEFFCKQQELETLKDLYNQDDDHQELGNFHIRASYAAKEQIEGRVAALQTAADAFYKAKNEFVAKATEDRMQLLWLQWSLEDKLEGQFLDLSLHDTITALMLGGHNKHAEQLACDFCTPVKRLWWLKLTALADLEDWEELEKFSKSKKSPIGYLPFVEICMKQHNKYKAKKYASHVGPEQKIKALLLIGDVAHAAAVAIEHLNEAELSKYCPTACKPQMGPQLTRFNEPVHKPRRSDESTLHISSKGFFLAPGLGRRVIIHPAPPPEQC